MDNDRRASMIRRGRRRGARPGLVQRPALLAAPPGALNMDALAEAPHRLVGEARIQGVLVIGLCAAFSLIGLLMMMQGGARIREARQVEAWVATQGVVENSDVYPVNGPQGDQWRPHVYYSYAVNGRLIHSARIGVGKPVMTDSREEALAWIERFPVGSSVTVHYDPAQITQSVLETDTPGSAYANLLFGCALASMGPALLAWFRRSAAQRAKWPAQADPAISGG